MNDLLQTFESLKKQIQEFDKYCPSNMLVNVSLGNNFSPMILYNIYYYEPNLIIFDFATYDKLPCRIIQNVNQLNIALSYIPKPENIDEKKPIGFEQPKPTSRT